MADYNVLSSDEYQILTSFPNENHKHIDYVLVYKDLNASEDEEFKTRCKRNQNIFFERLNAELFETYKIKVKHLNFVLLHCKIERLLMEAEHINLEMKLKTSTARKTVVEEENLGISNIIKIFKRPFKNDGTGSIASYRFDNSIKFIFEGIDNPNGPFNNTLRILIVDYILNNFMGPNDNLNQGLAYMLDNKFLDDAFVLHDQTADSTHLENFFDFVNETFNDDEELSKDFIDVYLNTLRNFKLDDPRKNLNNNWAKFSNILRLQPMWSIRNYFGEYYSIYFAWLGVFVYTLWFIALIGIIFCFISIGLDVGCKKNEINANGTDYSNVTVNSTFLLDRIFSIFDNQATPVFAFFLCIWGIYFIEYWKRENTKLAYEWDVENFEEFEPELPEYKRRQDELYSYFLKKGWFGLIIFKHIDFLKKLASTIVTLIMVAVVCMDIAAVILYRLYMTKKVFPNQQALRFIFGDVVSVLINAIFIIILQYFYNRMAKSLTKWENHKTTTMYKDSLIIKLFVFEFVNNFGYLFYLAYIRENKNFNNGLFNLGPDFQDKCEGSCMSLLSGQVFALLLIQPMPRFCYTVIYPYLIEKYKKRKIDDYFLSFDKKKNSSEHSINMRMNNEKAVFLYVSIEKTKTDACDTVIDEFTEKVLLFGYLILFSSCFPLGPLIVLLINLGDIRIDGQRLLWLFRRPVGHKAQDIGSWFYILRFLNVVGIVNNSFILGFTAKWIEKYEGTTEWKFIYAVLFEHIVFSIWFLVILFTPEVSDSIKQKMREESQIVQKIVKEAKFSGLSENANRKVIKLIDSESNPKISIESTIDQDTINEVKNVVQVTSNVSLSKID